MKQKDEVRLWLESYRELKDNVNRLSQKHARLLAQATRTTTQYRDMPGGGDGDKEKLLAALADDADELFTLMTRARERMRELEEFIDCIPTPICRIILRHRYIEGLSWVQMQFALQKSGYFYERTHIFRLHGDALKEARTLWRERKEESNEQ